MEGRYYGGLALLVGIVAVGGLACLSYRREHDDLALRIRSQRPIPAARGAPASIRIDFDPSRALRKVGQDGNVEYRVVDSEGRLYATSTSADEKKRSLSIPLGYGRKVRNPTLEMLVDGEPIASVRLAPLPEPKTRFLPARRSDLVRAFVPPEEDVTALRNGPTYGPRWVDLNIQPRHPLLNREFWEIAVLQTTLNDGAQGTSSTADIFQPAAKIPVLYGDDVTAVKVRVARFVPRSRSERVAITGLRLVRQGGQTRVEWRNAHVVNHLGLAMRLSAPSHPYEVYGPRDAAGDYRAPVVELRISPLSGAFKPNERIDPPIVQEDSSVPKALHLQSLTVIPKATGFYIPKGAIGGAGARGLPPPLVGGHPVLNKPFTLFIKVNLRSDEPLGGFEATIPVESAPSR